MARAISSAHVSVQAGRSAQAQHRYRLVFITLRAPGTSGSKASRAAGMPVMDSAPTVVPW